MTRTPAPAGVCPVLSDQVPTIAPILPGTAIIEGFEPQILGYLNAGGNVDDLRAVLGGLFLVDEDGATWKPRAQVVAVDVTGNATPEIVVALAFFVEGQYADGALFVFTCGQRQYEGGAVRALGGQVLPGGGPDPGVRAIQDMNGNGVPEIIYSYISALGTHANFTRLFQVIEWDGGQFVDLVQNETWPANAAPVNNGDGAVLDTNGNGNLELVLTNGVVHYYEDGGPQRERTDIWAWNGYALRLARLEFEPPVYRFQAVQDGDDATWSGRYDQALAFYEQVMSDERLLGWSEGQLWPDSAYGSEPTPTPDPDERSRLAAYAGFRAILVHALRGSLAEAQSAYETLQGQFPEGVPGHGYVQLATAFWRAYSNRGDIGEGCVQAVEHAAAHADNLLVPLGSDFYGYHNRDYTAEDVCPFAD